jgi:predicted thioesterase
MDKIKPGLIGERTTVVTENLSARHFGSGSVNVYATPAMIALMEAAAIAAIDSLLPEGYASVGTALNIQHLGATPLGQQVRAQAEVTQVDGKQVTFRVQAWDEHDRIGEGTHIRVIIEIQRFMSRVEKKRAAGG